MDASNLVQYPTCTNAVQLQYIEMCIGIAGMQ